MKEITVRKRHEQELSRLKNRYRAVTEHALDIITVIDDNGIIQYESQSIEQILGYSPDELVLKLRFGLYPNENTCSLSI